MLTEKIKQLINLPNTYIGEAPIAVDSCQWIRAAAGTSLVHFCKETYDKPAFLIYVRGSDNAETSKRTDDVRRKIQNFTDASGALLVKSLPRFVGKDDKHRSVYTFSIEYQTGGY